MKFLIEELNIFPEVITKIHIFRNVQIFKNKSKINIFQTNANSKHSVKQLQIIETYAKVIKLLPNIHRFIQLFYFFQTNVQRDNLDFEKLLSFSLEVNSTCVGSCPCTVFNLYLKLIRKVNSLLQKSSPVIGREYPVETTLPLIGEKKLI